MNYNKIKFLANNFFRILSNVWVKDYILSYHIAVDVVAINLHLIYLIDNSSDLEQLNNKFNY
jgi:hypothetical protein